MSAYTRELVEGLLPTIWDDGYVWGMVNEREPDPDMPKTKGAKNTKNTLWAHLVDIRRAWVNAPSMTLREMQALLLCGGMDMTQTEAGHVLGVNRVSVQEAYERGVSRLCDYLNGTDSSEAYAD